MPNKQPSALSSPLKYHGGKRYLAKRIVDLMPPHLHYCEPFAGGLSVLLAKDPEGVSEVVNDIDLHLWRFWNLLADPTYFAEFVRIVEAKPFCEETWRCAADAMRLSPPESYEEWVLEGVNFFIWCRQSLAGRMKSFTGITKTRVRRGMNNEVSAWLTAVEGLPAVHERLKRVLILNRDALDVIREQDGPDTLFYLDPPYVDETRTAKSVYRHEMTPEQHVELLSLLPDLRGHWMLSGYDSKLYQSFFKDFPHTRYEFDLPNNAASGPTKRRMTEVLWTNIEKA